MATTKIADSYLTRLLQCAVVYHDKAMHDIGPIPETLPSKAAALKHFTEALRFEAHQTMRRSIHLEQDPLLHAVNLDTSCPGIVAENDTTTGKIRVHTKRAKEAGPKKSNNDVRRLAIHAENVMERIARAEHKQEQRLKAQAKRREEREDAKRLDIYRKAAQAAAKEAFKLNAEKTLADAPRGKKKVVREEIRQERRHIQETTQRVAAAKKQAKRDERDAKRLQRDAAMAEKEIRKAAREAARVEKERVRAEQEAAPLEPETPAAAQEPAPGLPKTDHETSEASDAEGSDAEGPDPQLLLQASDSMTRAEASDEDSDGEAGDCTVDDVTFFASPVAFNRHIGALNSCSPHPDLLPTLLRGTTPSPQAIKMFHGPPGTGKTYRLIVELKRLMERSGKQRYLVCAGSNVGAANLYSRAKTMGVRGSLIMKKDKIPRGTFCDNAEVEAWHPADTVVFCTVSTRSSYLLRDQRFDAVLLDEAAQVQEACVWGLLRPEVSRLVMSGDPDQLPATVSEAGKKLNHDRSLMKRLIDLGVPAELLDTQRRMHPDIAAFSNKHFYDGKLKTAYTAPAHITEKAFEVVDVPRGKEQRVGTSYCNRAEADAVAKAVDKLCKKHITDVVVISPYAAQCDVLRTVLPPSVDIHTVDSFQGREADAVILCTVRTGANVGFWEDYRRLNVAMTRARHVLRVVGKVSTWRKAKHCALAKLA